MSSSLENGVISRSCKCSFPSFSFNLKLETLESRIRLECCDLEIIEVKKVAFPSNLKLELLESRMRRSLDHGSLLDAFLYKFEARNARISNQARML